MSGAEGATAPVNSQAKGPTSPTNSGERHRVPAEGITISGERTEGASERGLPAHAMPGTLMPARKEARWPNRTPI